VPRLAERVDGVGECLGREHVEEGRVRQSEGEDVVNQGLLDLHPHMRAWLVRMHGRLV
jgi:TolB-like protein